MTNTTTSMKAQAVTFSVSSELYILPAGKQDGSATWYSSQDKQYFRRSMVSSIRKASQEIEKLPPGATMTKEQLIDCLGIELFITKGAARSAAEVRRAHMDAILSEQQRQRQCGTCDIGRLSSISQQGSLWTKERALKLATGYAALSME
ncbi:hypothetical protein ACHAXH_007599 [Discostella pseudostelligera]